MTAMDSAYDLELKTSLKSLIDSGEIEVNEPDYYFELIERHYPISSNRIDWERVGGSIAEYIEEESKSEQLKKFLNLVLKEDSSLSLENVVVFGDDLLNFAYKLRFENFMKHHEIFFSIPQHTFVIFEESKKCINYTFENDI